jgi:uncharacterized protein (TIGR03790 family)
MRRFTTAFAVIAAILLLAACGGGRSATTPPALQSGSVPETEGMPSVPVPPIHAQRPPALNPLDLPLDLALARLPDRGVALFAQNTDEQVVHNLPLELTAEDGAEGLSIAVRTTEEMLLPDSLLLHLRFDPAKLAPVRAEFNESAFAEGSHLLLAVTETPGYVPLAAAKLPGSAPVTVPAGTELARVGFAHHAQTAAKAVAAAPAGDGNKVALNLSLSGPEQQDINVWFEERNLGDYDLNGTVSISDITPIAVHFGERDGVSLPVIDTSGNDKVDIADVTAIAMNFGSSLSGYDLEVEFTPEGGGTQAFARIPNASNPDLPTLPRPNVSLPSGWPTYNYQLHNADFGQYRLRAVAVGASLTEKGVTSVAMNVLVENLPPAPPSSLYVSTATRTSVTVNWSQSPASDLLGYNIYITQDSAANELADFTQANAELLPTTTQELTVTELTPTTDYWFVIEAVDEAFQPSLEGVVMDTKVLGATVITPIVAILAVGVEEHYELDDVDFSGNQCYSPDGADLVRFTYDWGDGSPPEDVPPPGDATHAFDFGIGPVDSPTMTLTVEDEYGAVGMAQMEVPVTPLRRDVFVVYNLNSPEDEEIAEYYADRETGRGIHPDYVYGMALSTSEIIDRTTYDTTIRDPLRDHLEDTGQKDDISYIVTCRNVPIRVSGSSGYTGSYACVDSELCLLYEDYELEPHTVNPYYGWLSSDQTDKGNPAKSQPWEPFHFTYDGLTMDYLVTRLSGWSKEDAMAIVDRSKAADTAVVTDYVVVFDDADKAYDMMNDPTADSSESAVDVFQRLGLDFFADTVQITPPDEGVKIYASTLTGEGFNPNVVVGYCSHGVHSGLPSLYIINSLNFNYLPGALFMSYESFNGTIFRGDPYTHGSHGQVADWILMGGTGGIGNIYEPYSDACGDESIIFAEYVHCGRNLAEALYKGLRRVSWVEVVLGDPLCKLNVP